MKKIYWRPQGMPVFALVFVALFSIGGLTAVEYFQSVTEKPHYAEKLEAANLALKAMNAIREERLRRDIPIDPGADPAGSGLIGSFMSPVTSHPGDLDSKQTSINPNFAAVIVDLLKKARVNENDCVAISLTGSFPAINICVYAAASAMKLKPIIVSSVASSQWGANEPAFLWIDMEQFLFSRGIFPFRSTAVSMGGSDDRGGELSEQGRKLIIDAAKRNQLDILNSPGLAGSIDDRMEIYFSRTPPRVLVNVGGGVASAGVRSSRVLLKPGLLTSLSGEIKDDSVISRFLNDEKIPVIHIENIRQLARSYGLSVNPHNPQKVGEGELYFQYRYNLWLTGLTLGGIIFGLYIFGRVDWGFRMLRSSHTREVGPPEPMV
jgi:poly-gamma-glutamate system protein